MQQQGCNEVSKFRTNRQLPVQWPLFQVNLRKPAPIWILMKQEMMGWQWH